MNHSSERASVAPAGGEKILAGLLEAARALEERVEGTLGEVGLSSPRLSVLTELVNAPGPLPLSELAARLSCVRSNITQLVDRLEADGLVRRVHDASDRRSIRAEITPLGRERQAAGSQRMNAVQQEFATRLEGVDVGALHQALAALT
jgi:DNA-binding MarR family transcriptional regulator